MNKKAISFILVLAMVLAMSTAAFASDTDLRFTTPYSDTFITKATAGSTVTLMVGPADYSTWAFTGFSTTAAAATVTWQSTDTGLAAVQSCGPDTEVIENDDSTTWSAIVSKAIIKVDDYADHGACSIAATWENMLGDPQTVNFTIFVEKASGTVTPAAGIMQEIVDYESGTYFYVANYDSTVALPASTLPGSSTPNAIYASSKAAQTYSTPIDALVAIVSPGALGSATPEYLADIGISSGTPGNPATGYVYSVSLRDNNQVIVSLAAAGSRGWNYGVYRLPDYELVSASRVIGAGQFELQDYDYVIWYYGTMEEAKAYFGE